MAIDLAQRADEPELLDEGVPEDEARASLADLRFVNRWLGNRDALLAAVAPYLRGVSSPTLLDVGCGSGDVPSYLAGRVPGLRAFGLDVKLLHLQAAPASLRRLVADVKRPPFADRAFDVVTASLFLHHFDAGELPGILRTLFGLARRALVVNDLRRARVPYLFGRAVFPLMFRSRVSVTDGLISIRSGFHEDELRRAFAEAGVPDVELSRRWPYRLLAVAPKV